MEGKMKFYYLAEKSGWNMSRYAFSYRPALGELLAVKVLSVNVLDAKNHLARSAQEIVDAYDHLKLETRSVEETFILETRLNYLALHSYPEYYLNPLAIDPNYEGNVDTIGQLIVDAKGKDESINELIQDETISMEEKKEILRNKTDFWREEMEELVSLSIAKAKKHSFSARNRSKGKQISLALLDGFSCFLINLFFVLQLCLPNHVYWSCFYEFEPYYVLSYVSILFPILLFLFDISYVLYHSYFAKISEPYNYARRFLRRNSNKVYDDIQAGSEKMLFSLIGAANDKILLENDITSFSKLSSSYVDFKAIFEAENLRKGKLFRFLHSLLNILRTLAFSFALFTLIVYILSLVFSLPF